MDHLHRVHRCHDLRDDHRRDRDHRHHHHDDDHHHHRHHHHRNHHYHLDHHLGRQHHHRDHHLIFIVLVVMVFDLVLSGSVSRSGGPKTAPNGPRHAGGQNGSI